MSAQLTYRFYSVSRQTILLVNGEPLGRERVKVYIALCELLYYVSGWYLTCSN